MTLRSSCGALACCLTLVLAAGLPSGPAGAATPLKTIRVASGLAFPVYFSSPPGDTTRAFIVEAQTGRIRILNLQTGVVNPAPFLTQVGMVAGGERGLLGMAFHPDYPESGHIYVNYTSAPNGDSVIRRYSVSTDPDRADTSTGMTLLTIPPNDGPNHNAGWLGFGPDGYLYVPMGDKGDGGYTKSQNDSTRQGKILRIDVDGGLPYAIPPDNPYAGSFSPRDEIWAKGMRNPWRASFDRGTGDLYVAEVGQAEWEEIDYQPASSPGGENYGWALMEGYEITPVCLAPCDTAGLGLTLPVHVYDQSSPSPRCAVIGGYVYRGTAIPDLQGAYFFADFCSNEIWSLRVAGGSVTEVIDRTAELAPGGGLGIEFISTFGEDAQGELYIGTLDGEIYKIIANPTSVDGDRGSSPPAIVLGRPSPNPSRTGCAFAVTLDSAGHARIGVFDAGGRLVRRVAERAFLPGVHRLGWDGRDDRGERVAEGVYLLRVDSDGAEAGEKLVVVR